jgi:hypothetical protein
LDLSGFEEPKLPMTMEAARGDFDERSAVGIFAGVCVC